MKLKKCLLMLPICALILLCACAADPDILMIDRAPCQRSQYAAAYQYSRIRLRADMEQRGLPEADVLSDPALREEYCGLLREMAQEQLTLQTAVEKLLREQGVRVKLKEKDLLREAKEHFGGGEAFQAYLRENGLSEGAYLEILKLQLRMDELADACVTDAADENAFRDLLEQRMQALPMEIVGDIAAITPETVESYLR